MVAAEQSPQQSKQALVDRFIRDLHRAMAEIEGTPFLKITITAGTGDHYDVVCEKRRKVKVALA